MNWNKDKSIRLSIICVYCFMAILLLADVFMFRITGWYVGLRKMKPVMQTYMMITAYGASVFAWLCLSAMYNLLTNIRDGRVFISANIRDLRQISWCCAGATAIMLISGIYYQPFLIIAIASAFMMLIVRIIKNIMQQAIEMKDELELMI